MKTHSVFFAVILAAAIVSTPSLHALVVRNGGETTITLDYAFAAGRVGTSRVTVPPTEHLTITVAPELARLKHYAWFKDGQPIPGATDPVLVIDVAQPSDAGVYRYDTLAEVHIPESGSDVLMLNVRPATNLVNLSTRAFVGQGGHTMIGGFVVTGITRGAIPSTLLIRAVGPTLARFGVAEVLKEPKIAIFSADGTPYTGEFHYPLETGYITKAQHIKAITARVGAFPLDAESKDAVDLRPFPPGTYTVHVTGLNGSTGDVLLETYEVPDPF